MRQGTPEALVLYQGSEKGISVSSRVNVVEIALIDVLARLFRLEEAQAALAYQSSAGGPEGSPPERGSDG